MSVDRSQGREALLQPEREGQCTKRPEHHCVGAAWGAIGQARQALGGEESCLSLILFRPSRGVCQPCPTLCQRCATLNPTLAGAPPPFDPTKSARYQHEPCCSHQLMLEWRPSVLLPLH